MKEGLFITLVVLVSIYALTHLLFGSTGTDMLVYGTACLITACQLSSVIVGFSIHYLAEKKYNEMPEDMRNFVMNHLYDFHTRAIGTHVRRETRQYSYYIWPIVVGAACALSGWHVIGALYVVSFFVFDGLMRTMYEEIMEYLHRDDIEEVQGE